MNRLLGTLLATLAVVCSACGISTTTVEGSPRVAPPVPKTIGEYVEAIPAPSPVGSITEHDDTLACKAGLTPLELPTTDAVFNKDNYFGDFEVVVNEAVISGLTPVQTLRYTFHGTAPQVYGAFIIAIDMSAENFGKYYPVAWLPGMDRSFVVTSSDFGDGLIASVTLCI